MSGEVFDIVVNKQFISQILILFMQYLFPFIITYHHIFCLQQFDSRFISDICVDVKVCNSHNIVNVIDKNEIQDFYANIHDYQ